MVNPIKPVRIFVTGGTFDKEYDMIRGQLFFKDTHILEMLNQGRCTLPVELRTLMMIDSLEMTPEDRAMIALNCEKCEENNIVITHGTDTMVTTAKLLAERQINKTIVLTGALIPFKFGSSDGFFNLGSALAFAEALPNGVYVAMNGQYFHWDNVQKNRSTGYFERLG
ncbi:MAG: asparaginase domain-containing protein [Chitinophagales bacterium]